MARQQSSKDLLLFWAFMALFIFLPLPFASNRLWAWPFFAAIIFILAATWLALYITGRIQVSFGVLSGGACWVGLLLLFVAVWIAFQALELPKDWLSFLSPKATELWGRHDLMATPTISLDPAISKMLALRSATYGLIFFLFLFLVNSEERLKLFLYTIVLSGTMQALYGGLMVLSGLEYSFFVEKDAYRGFATGTFINRNHLAGYLEMALAAGLGLLVAGLRGERHGSWRARLRHWLGLILSETAVLRLALVIMATGLILTRSRMGNTAFIASLSSIGGLMLLLSCSTKLSTILLFISVIAVDIALIGSWFGLEKLAQRIEQTSFGTENRDEINEFVWPIVKDFWITGSGAGSFPVIFPYYVTADLGEGFYEHAHNDYFEFWGELGVIGCFPLLVAVLLSLIAAFKSLGRMDHSLAKAAGFASLMAIISLLIHSTVDFNLQMPANASTYVAFLAMPWVALSIKKTKQSRSSMQRLYKQPQ